MQKGAKKKPLRKPQHQRRPGYEDKLKPKPDFQPTYQSSGKLIGKVALITGGDSGIGRAVSILFAKEGADIAIAYLSEHRDAEETQSRIEEYKRECTLIAGDLSKEANCKAHSCQQCCPSLRSAKAGRYFY